MAVIDTLRTVKGRAVVLPTGTEEEHFPLQTCSQGNLQVPQMEMENYVPAKGLKDRYMGKQKFYRDAEDRCVATRSTLLWRPSGRLYCERIKPLAD